MARTGLSFEDVSQAADRISARGERVTLRSVRAELGTGSLTTIGRHLDEYQGSKKRETANKIDATLELPGKIVEAILAEIEAQKSGAVEEITEELETANADRQALAAEVERLTLDVENALKDKAAEQGRCSAVTDQLGIERAARIQAENELHAVREQLAAQKARTEQVDRLQAEVEQLRHDLIGEREKRHAAELCAIQIKPPVGHHPVSPEGGSVKRTRAPKVSPPSVS